LDKVHGRTMKFRIRKLIGREEGKIEKEIRKK
jgi:hypothetical protein